MRINKVCFEVLRSKYCPETFVLSRQLFLHTLSCSCSIHVYVLYTLHNWYHPFIVHIVYCTGIVRVLYMLVGLYDHIHVPVTFTYTVHLLFASCIPNSWLVCMGLKPASTSSAVWSALWTSFLMGGAMGRMGSSCRCCVRRRTLSSPNQTLSPFSVMALRSRRARYCTVEESSISFNPLKIFKRLIMHTFSTITPTQLRSSRDLRVINHAVVRIVSKTHFFPAVIAQKLLHSCSVLETASRTSLRLLSSLLLSLL